MSKPEPKRMMEHCLEWIQIYREALTSDLREYENNSIMYVKRLQANINLYLKFKQLYNLPANENEGF